MSAGPFVPPELCATRRFVVRAYREGDGRKLAEALNASYTHLRTFMPWAVAHTSVEQAEQYARRSRAHTLLASDFALAVFDREERVLLGGTGFHLRGRGLDERAAEIGLWIRQESAGSGLGSQVLQAMLLWGFSDWPWERLAWTCSARNAASARVAEKAGLRLEGRLRGYHRLPDGTRDDQLVFAALRGEWLARRG